MLTQYSRGSPADKMIGDLTDILNINYCILSEFGVISLNHGRLCR